MKQFTILCMALFMMACTQQNTIMNQNQSIENILTRKSIRQFTGEKPTDTQIDTLLRCAMSAPSAMNKQPWIFIVVDDEVVLAEIGEKMPNSQVQNGAKVAFVMCGDMNKTLSDQARDFWICDVSAATENLLLAAHSMGFGAVWTGVYPMMENVAKVQDILSLPENIIPLCIVPVGTPNENPEVKDKWNTENIHYNQW